MYIFKNVLRTLKPWNSLKFKNIEGLPKKGRSYKKKSVVFIEWQSERPCVSTLHFQWICIHQNVLTEMQGRIWVVNFLITNIPLVCWLVTLHCCNFFLFSKWLQLDIYRCSMAAETFTEPTPFPIITTFTMMAREGFKKRFSKDIMKSCFFSMSAEFTS